jgi:hypothetical protein
VQVATGTPQGTKRPAGTKPPPAVIFVLSDGAIDGGRVKLPDAVTRARNARIPIFTGMIGTEAGVVQVPHVGGYIERIQVPPDPNSLRQVATQTGGSFFAAPNDRNLSAVTQDLKSRLGTTHKDERCGGVRGGRDLAPPGRLCPPALWFRRSRDRGAIGLVALLAVLTVSVPASSAADGARACRCASRWPARGWRFPRAQLR